MVNILELKRSYTCETKGLADWLKQRGPIGLPHTYQEMPRRPGFFGMPNPCRTPSSQDKEEKAAMPMTALSTTAELGCFGTSLVSTAEFVLTIL